MDLIDRSKIEAFGATCKSQDYMDGVKDTLEYIDNLPTVDAIPISFIVDFKDQYCYAGSSKVDVNIADALVELLLCWEEEQEKVDKKKSYFPKGFFSKERPLAKGEEDGTD